MDEWSWARWETRRRRPELVEAVGTGRSNATFGELLQGALDSPDARRAVIADALALDQELYGVSDAEAARAEAAVRPTSMASPMAAPRQAPTAATAT